MAEDAQVSEIALRFDALHIGEGELNLRLTVIAVSARFGYLTGSGTISRSLDPPVPPTSVPRVLGMYQSLDGGAVHLHLSGKAESGGGATSAFSASASVDKGWGGRGTFAYAGFDVGPCVVTREG